MDSAEFYKENSKRNFLALIMDGAFYTFSMGMAPLTTVMMFFVSGFVTQKWILDLLPCLFFFLVFTPQVMISKKVESLRFYKSFTILINVIHRLPWLLLALDVILFADKNPTLFVIIFYNVNMNNLSIDLCKDKANLPTYIGLRCLVTGPFIAFSALFAGFLINGFGYPVMFIISVLFILAGIYVLAAKVKVNNFTRQ
jgi:hypothetical protein